MQKADSPKDAQTDEEHSAKYDSGSPGQTEESEKTPEQKVKREPSNEQPTDSGEARGEANKVSNSVVPTLRPLFGILADERMVGR